MDHLSWEDCWTSQHPEIQVARAKADGKVYKMIEGMSQSLKKETMKEIVSGI